MKKVVKKMVREYARSRCDDQVWNMFYTMCGMGFITRKEWNRFWCKCSDWSYSADRNLILEDGGKVVYDCEKQTFIK